MRTIISAIIKIAAIAALIYLPLVLLSGCQVDGFIVGASYHQIDSEFVDCPRVVPWCGVILKPKETQK